MGRRLELQTLLEDLIGENGHVYFQPPNQITILYPCIVYTRYQERTLHADNKPYLQRPRYTVTIITRDPDSDLVEKVGSLPLCAFERHFATDNLNHDVYNLYF